MQYSSCSDSGGSDYGERKNKNTVHLDDFHAKPIETEKYVDEFGQVKSGKIFPMNKFMKGLLYKFRCDPQIDWRKKIKKMRRHEPTRLGKNVSHSNSMVSKSPIKSGAK